MPTRSSHAIPTYWLDGQAPEVTGYEWEHCVDLVTLRNVNRVTTARVPARGRVEIVAPEMVVWAYQCPAAAGATGVIPHDSTPKTHR